MDDESVIDVIGYRSRGIDRVGRSEHRLDSGNFHVASRNSMIFGQRDFDIFHPLNPRNIACTT